MSPASAEALTFGRSIAEQLGVSCEALLIVDESLADVGDLDNLLAVLRLTGGVVATVDLTRNARYGDYVRSEVLGSHGAVFVDFLPTAKARLATGAGVETLPGSEVADATAAGVVAQAAVFAAAIRGEEVDYPGARESARATEVGRAVNRSAATGRAEGVAP